MPNSGCCSSFGILPDRTEDIPKRQGGGRPRVAWGGGRGIVSSHAERSGTLRTDDIWGECARIARDGGLAALATVARRRGSLPMSATAKMLVTAGGARIGTVGGGCMEAEITERALDVIDKRLPALSCHTLNAEMAGDYGLTCGGTASVFIEPVYSDPVLAAAYAAAAHAVAAGEHAVMATALDWTGTVVKALVVTGGDTHGEAPPDLIRAARRLPLDAESPVLRRSSVLDPVLSKPALLVFGGGHVGGAVARAAAFAGWSVTVVDDRADYAEAPRHPFADRTVCCDFHDVSAAIVLTPRTYAVVATRGHQHDALIVDQLAKHDLRYLGMLGSRRKVALTWKLLESWGHAPERLAQVHAPVGLPIGADTPEEIAVSVVAEMIAVRRAVGVRRGGRGALSSSQLTAQGERA
ncbi:MAG TPA: XdhC family protein [Gemmatimonadaceae bacterium]|nr:XdhC family protein [Gemmatimonadaceae bacterium]